jgi:hypothetical protein
MADFGIRAGPGNLHRTISKFLPESGHAVPSKSEETMGRRVRRNHTPAFKSMVAFAAIRGEITLTQLLSILTSTRTRHGVEGLLQEGAGKPTSPGWRVRMAA